jgi:hypothetical protein
VCGNKFKRSIQLHKIGTLVMLKDDFEFLIASAPDREELTCEIYYKGELIAEISQETSVMLVEVYPPPKARWLTMPLLELQEAFEVGRKHLLGEPIV